MQVCVHASIHSFNKHCTCSGAATALGVRDSELNRQFTPCSLVAQGQWWRQLHNSAQPGKTHKLVFQKKKGEDKKIGGPATGTGEQGGN